MIEIACNDQDYRRGRAQCFYQHQLDVHELTAREP